MTRYIDADKLLSSFDPDGTVLDPIFVRSRIVQARYIFEATRQKTALSAR